MDFMGLATNLFNTGTQIDAGFSAWRNVLATGSGTMPNPMQFISDPNLVQQFQAAGGSPNLMAGAPPMPPRESFIWVQQQQDMNKQAEEGLLKDLQAEIDDRKEAFYEQRGETRAQRLDRRERERTEKQQLRERQEAEKRALTQRAMDAVNSGNRPGTTSNNANMQTLQEQLAAEERAMNLRHQSETLSVGTPPELRGFVDNGVQRVRDMQANNEATLRNSPQFQQVQAYQQQQLAYAEQMRQGHQTDLMGQGNQWSPEMNQNFFPGQQPQF